MMKSAETDDVDFMYFLLCRLQPEVHQTTKAAGLDKHVIKLICGQYGYTRQVLTNFFGCSGHAVYTTRFLYLL